MRENALPVDVDAVLGGLKDFQRDTVDYVFRRLYEDEDTARRFLIADETGLGKTLVARGVVARAIAHLRERGTRRIDILYICSNADIARQNINRLNVTGKRDFALASRITLLPTTVHELEKNDLNFISFTPGTSFELGNTMGWQDERALLYHLLKKPWDLGDRKAPQNVLQGERPTTENFRNLVAGFRDDRHIDEKLEASFREDLERRIAHEREEGGEDIRARFERLCGRFGRADSRVSRQENRERTRLVGELRGLLATACLEALEPDLIILDEFQRFKHLLDGTDAASQLARGLFEYGDARTLLLSATPYKMYTLSHEAADDDHYADFLRTLEFLEFGVDETEKPQVALAEYRRSLFHLDEGGLVQAEAAKHKLEARLRRVMVRTEKLAASQDRDGMLVEVPPDVRLDPLDLEAYVGLRRVLDASGGADALEYWKSAPYLLNFMDGYKLKQQFDEALDEGGGGLPLAAGSANGLFFPWGNVAHYAEVDPANARLRSLLAGTVETGAWKLLWVPPSQPYYELEDPYSEPSARRFTKRLIFSSWRVVPKALAAMVSYDAERRMVCSNERNPENSTEWRARRSGRLSFAFSEGRLTGMPVLGLLYPSTTLARECDPLALGHEPNGELLSAARVREKAERHIEELLEQVGAGRVVYGAEDEAWYWAAPIMFDLHRDEQETRKWFVRDDLAGRWSDGRRGEENDSRWVDHVEQARVLVSGELVLGRPPRDLASVLASTALAGPGVAAMRALGRVAGGAGQTELRDAAARVAWHLRSLFNLPETASLVRSTSEEGAPYWQSALGYSVSGCLQAVLDEYAHVLRESQGLFDTSPGETADVIAGTMCSALGLQASSISVDDFEVNRRSNEIRRGRGGTMRGRFALRFGDERAEDGSERTRSGQVREAFNSPFWPFVLATTSVGQEGLDFHTYCHAVVHWNLPSNPVDLEQREGRVHRYKNHAVRKNLAARYGLGGMSVVGADPWEGLFGVARSEREEGSNDMVPFWIYPIEDGAKIERHVPALPLSRERDRLSALKRSLVAYRMVFGQARQEDLLSYLLARFTDEEVSAYSDALRIDLQPPRNGRGGG